MLAVSYDAVTLLLNGGRAPKPWTCLPTPMPPFNKIVLATRNPGKVAEIRAVLADLPVTLVAASDIAGAPNVTEDAPSLRGNAAKKARALHEFTGLPALADDTGLEVEALDGRPGAHAGRYAGPGCSPGDNRALLRAELHRSSNRAALFRTVIALAHEGGLEFFHGECHGRILEEERGSGGFGYDPIFAPEGYALSFGELSAEEKNAVSHRGHALRAFAAYMRE